MKISQITSIDEETYAAFMRMMPQLTTAHPAPTHEALNALAAFPGSRLLVARHEETSQIIGTATLCLVYAPTGIHARLEDVVVDEAFRGRGVGEALTLETIRLAREAGANYMALTSNPRREAANRLYQRLGFKRWETNLYRYEL